MPLSVWTIGHSNRSLEAFVEILGAHQIQSVADIRTVPRSRHNPQFNAEALQTSLPRIGILYAGLQRLGGLRSPRPDSRHGGLRDEAMRGYADYMETAEFEKGVEELLSLARAARTAFMCAEAVHDRCHRSLLSDALLCRGIDVVHLVDAQKSATHRLTPHVKIRDGRPTYPVEQVSLSELRS